MTQISTMTPLNSLPASGAVIPIAKAGDRTPYNYDLAAYVTTINGSLAAKASLSAIAATTGAALVGTTAGGTVQDYITNPGSAGPITASFTAPAFTNSAYYSSIQYRTNGAVPGTMYSGLFAGNNATEAHTAAIIVPATATNLQTNAHASYIRSDRAAVANGADVSAFHVAISNASNGNVMPVNTLAADTTGKTGQTLGNELDFNVSAADTNVNGVNATIVSTSGGALTGTRIAFAARGVFSTNSQWSHGFYTPDGAIAQYAVFVGAVSSTTSTNRDSQPIALTSYNSSNTRFIATIIGDHLGGMAVRAGAAGGSIAFQDPTGATNWAAINASGLGYPTGVGGAVTQATSKATNVTLNKVCGQVTLNNAALASAAKVSFAVANSMVAATDTIIVNVASGGTANAYRAAVTAVSAGGFTITVENITGGSLSEAPVLNFSILKSIAA